MNCDNFFHCQGNYDAVHLCEKTANDIRIAKKISDCREELQDPSSTDSQADQRANKFGRDGGVLVQYIHIWVDRNSTILLIVQGGK
ncbi:unnamed protein product [Rotaria sp. Silwood1]|nr:unnamed protein product [Rotaria sp. Silwood1]CAF1006971.1 unnamed protein product [Rotaria sp. Silwood1]